MSKLPELLDILASIDQGTLREETANLMAIRDWAQRQACGDLKVGDVVRIRDGYEVSPRNSDGSPNGWWHYRECLEGGSQAEITEIRFSTHRSDWYAGIRLPQEWSVSEFAGTERRYWHGPATETPEGMEPLSEFDQEAYPEGRKHTFMFPLRDLDLKSISRGVS